MLHRFSVSAVVGVTKFPVSDVTATGGKIWCSGGPVLVGEKLGVALHCRDSGGLRTVELEVEVVGVGTECLEVRFLGDDPSFVRFITYVTGTAPPVCTFETYLE
jgi:hypothetical protein